MRFVLQTADVVSDARNCFYPSRVEVESAEDLREAVRFDHVCGSYRKDYRSIGNFLRSDVLVMDCDNDHTEDPGEWITAEKLDDLMPGMHWMQQGSFSVRMQGNASGMRDGQILMRK